MYLHKLTPTLIRLETWAPHCSEFSPYRHGDTCFRNVMVCMLQLWHHYPRAPSSLCGHLYALPSTPAGAPRAEAEEEAAGAPDGPVQRGRKVPCSASQTERGTGSAGGILPQQQQQHHLSRWATGRLEEQLSPHWTGRSRLQESSAGLTPFGGCIRQHQSKHWTAGWIFPPVFAHWF